MDYIYNDNKYMEIVQHILADKHFNKICDQSHHGCSRMDHSLRVSYLSYRISRLLGFDYEETARAGLLHDFFLLDNDTPLEKIIRYNFIHAKVAVVNASKYFDLTDREADIIETHMFPLNLTPPKYIEGWVVSTVDKTVALFEHLFALRTKLRFATNLFAIFLIKFLR